MFKFEVKYIPTNREKVKTLTYGKFFCWKCDCNIISVGNRKCNYCGANYSNIGKKLKYKKRDTY